MSKAYALLREALVELRPVEMLPVEAMLKFHDLAELLRPAPSVETRTGPVHSQPQVIITTDYKQAPCS